jgi:hypothetical protein
MVSWTTTRAQWSNSITMAAHRSRMIRVCLAFEAAILRTALLDVRARMVDLLQLPNRQLMVVCHHRPTRKARMTISTKYQRTSSMQHEACGVLLVKPAQLLVGMHAMVEVISTSTMLNSPTHGKELSPSRGVNQSTTVFAAPTCSLKSMLR